jgi:hypothetical protein
MLFDVTGAGVSAVQGSAGQEARSPLRGERCRDVPVDGSAMADLYRKSLEWGTESARGL